MRVYLIRHGQSENNILTEDTILQRKVDPDLTKLGYEQRDYLAEFLTTTLELHETSFGFTHLYCSAMHRALLTVQPVAKAFDMQPQVWVDLHEKGGMFLREKGHVNGFKGMTRASILKEFPNYDLPDTIKDNGWYDSEMGTEPETHSFYRAIKVATALQQRAESDDVLALVSHAGFLDILLKAIFNQLPSRPRTTNYYHYNTAITRIDYHGQRPVLHYMNRVDHLPSDKRSG
jgi:2,3-bisphosphoglycerate-dependent phosphoglycerate mutase